MSDLYDRDFYAWAAEQSALLRAGKLSAADVEHIAEEIESTGRGRSAAENMLLNAYSLDSIHSRARLAANGLGREICPRVRGGGQELCAGCTA